MHPLKDLVKKTGTVLLPPLLKMVFSGLKLTIIPPGEPLPGTQRGVIFAFWHGKMVAGWLLAQKLFPGVKTSAVVSLSEDGRILSETLDRFGFRLIRGSSSRGAEEVKAGIRDALHSGGLVVVTPDGPRGPLHRFKYGTLRLASEHRVPVVFAEITYRDSRVLKSWDRFEIPVPFTRATVTLHLLHVPTFESEEALHEYTRLLEKRFSHA
jgi:lysophospholipid acyltransferase (LPLAT)-like uncharacterized protein